MTNGQNASLLNNIMYFVKGGAEPPFTGAFVDTCQDGIYRCSACYTPLFSSDP